MGHSDRHTGERKTTGDRSRPRPHRAQAVAELSRRSVAPAPGPIERGHRAGRLVPALICRNGWSPVTAAGGVRNPLVVLLLGRFRVAAPVG
jgi:hypothetical protein